MFFLSLYVFWFHASAATSANRSNGDSRQGIHVVVDKVAVVPTPAVIDTSLIFS